MKTKHSIFTKLQGKVHCSTYNNVSKQNCKLHLLLTFLAMFFTPTHLAYVTAACNFSSWTTVVNRTHINTVNVWPVLLNSTVIKSTA